MVQLPAINTPQFGWARNKMPAMPQPVPPIFQPEAAARAIFHAAQDAPLVAGAQATIAAKYLFYQMPKVDKAWCPYCIADAVTHFCLRLR